MSKLSGKIDELQMLFNRLSARERVLVLFAGGALTVVFVSAIIMWINSSLYGLKDRVETKRDSYERVLTLQSRYERAKENAAKFSKEIGGSRNTLTQDIGSLAQQNGIELSQISQSKGAIDKKAKIREESVKIEMRRVELPPLLTFLEGIEKKNKLFFINDLNMRRRFDNKEQIDVSFKVSTLVPLEEE